MKKFLTNIDYKYWIPRLASIVVLSSFLSAHAASPQPTTQFSYTDHEILNSEINRFKKECDHVSILDKAKLQTIQSFYASKKMSMTDKQNECVESNMTQLIATHNIYEQTCDEISSSRKKKSDADAARLFVNVRKLKDGIRRYHEKLNECLILNGAKRDLLLPYADYERNSRILSKKLRDLNLDPPFKENGVDYR